MGLERNLDTDELKTGFLYMRESKPFARLSGQPFENGWYWPHEHSQSINYYLEV